MEKKDLIVIGGATASGKTSLAVKIAAELSCEIISADSRQVYRRMDIGTGKDLSEYNINNKIIPYHCIDIREPEEYFTLHDYIKECRAAIEKVRSRNIVPILAGGTGLYIESVIRQYILPDIPPDYKLREELEAEEKDTLSEKLRKINTDLYSRTDLSSRKRIIRAIEKAVYLDQNNNFSNSDKPLEINPVVLVTRWDRKELVSRIEKRLDERIKEGMIEEVQSLLDEGTAAERLISFGMEYRYITEYINGSIDFAEMREKLFTEIRRLSKRQTTYFRGMEKRGIEINFIDNADFEAAMDVIMRYKYICR